MIPFKKKPVEEELDGPKPAKKVRRRKKAEPIKPWGKLERFIIFIFLIGAPLLSILFLSRAKDPKIPISIPIKVQAKDVNQLKNDLTNLTENLTGTYGIWIQALDNSFTLGINENTQFDGASIFKLPLMIAYYKKVDAGVIDPDTAYTLKYSDAAAGAGVLSSIPAGTTVSYKDIVDAMGKNSDNSAFSIMFNILGSDSESKMINELGMKNTNFDTSNTTPYDVGMIFYKLLNSNLISENSKKDLLTSLTDTDFENLIPAGIPDSIKIAHKYGSDDGELNDAGIIYTNKPFILVILSKDIDASEAEVEIPKLAELVYNWAK